MRDYCANCGGDIVFASAPEYRVWLHIGSGRPSCPDWAQTGVPPSAETGILWRYCATPRRTVGDGSVWNTIRNDPVVRSDIEDFTQFLEKRGVRRTVGDSAELDARDAGQRGADEAR